MINSAKFLLFIGLTMTIGYGENLFLSSALSNWTALFFNSLYFKVAILIMFLFGAQITFFSLLKEMPIRKWGFIPFFFLVFSVLYVLLNICHLLSEIYKKGQHRLFDHMVVFLLVILSIFTCIFFLSNHRVVNSPSNASDEIQSLLDNVQGLIRKNNDRINNNRR